jgi:hypothetical protein
MMRILGTAVMAVVAFVQVGRDRILSLISGTTPGRIDWNREFITRILIYGLVPVLTLLGARFPEALRSILSALSRTAP